MRIFHAIFFSLLLSACLTTPGPDTTPTADSPFVTVQEENPYSPKPEDLGKQQASVIVTSVDLSERSDLSPVRVEVSIFGSMPSVCNELRVTVDPPTTAYEVHIEAYSVADPNQNCENVFQQFEGHILLGAYTPGRYTIWVNDTFVGDMISN